jgi:hypothetical protein
MSAPGTEAEHDREGDISLSQRRPGFVLGPWLTIPPLTCSQLGDRSKRVGSASQNKVPSRDLQLLLEFVSSAFEKSAEHIEPLWTRGYS